MLQGSGVTYAFVQTALPRLLEEGIDPDVCAERIVRAVEKGKDEVLIAGRKETTGVWLKRLAPGLLNRLMSRLEAN